MEFLGIGPLELVFFLVIALLLFGPQDMAKAGLTIGRFLRRIVLSEEWRAFNQGLRELRQLPTTLMREAGMEAQETRDLEKIIQEPFQQTNALLRDLVRDMPVSTTNIPAHPQITAADKNSAAGYGTWSSSQPPSNTSIQTPPTAPPAEDTPTTDTVA
ncbi:MAG: hypothetical protein Fur0018_04400 [Anaerolineales bacterium]